MLACVVLMIWRAEPDACAGCAGGGLICAVSASGSLRGVGRPESITTGFGRGTCLATTWADTPPAWMMSELPRGAAGSGARATGAAGSGATAAAIGAADTPPQG